jgi:hypothetical protein
MHSRNSSKRRVESPRFPFGTPGYGDEKGTLFLRVALMISPWLCVSVRKAIERGGRPDACGAGQLCRSITEEVSHGGTETRRKREGAHRRVARLGARGSGAWRPPVAFRPDASRDPFSGAWLRLASFEEPRSAAAPRPPGKRKTCRAHESWILMDSEPATTHRLFPRPTGLPSRSALIAPPLRLAALRWLERPVLLE